MSNNFKDIETKHRMYYLFDDMINIKIFDPNKIKIHEKSFKNMFIYDFGYVKVIFSLNNEKKCLLIYHINKGSL